MKALLLPVLLLLTSCDSSFESRQPAASIAVTPGMYVLSYEDGKTSRAQWDVVKVPESTAANFLHNFVPYVIDKLKPSYGAPSYKASDYPCKISNEKIDGGLLTATATCTKIPTREDNNFDIMVKSFGDGFGLEIFMTGRGVSAEEKRRTYTIMAVKQ